MALREHSIELVELCLSGVVVRERSQCGPARTLAGPHRIADP
ncbi:MAG: hypothetical protein WB677_21030 [Xanthobacteraceae bacterium]